MFREPVRFVIPAILILAECHPCSENIARSINQSLVRSFVIESRITPFSRILLGPARTRSPDYPIGTGFPFVDRHSSVFSRRIPLHLPLVLVCSRPNAASLRPCRAVLWERRDSRRSRRRMGDSRGDKDDQVEE